MNASLNSTLTPSRHSQTRGQLSTQSELQNARMDSHDTRDSAASLMYKGPSILSKPCYSPSSGWHFWSTDNPSSRLCYPATYSILHGRPIKQKRDEDGRLTEGVISLTTAAIHLGYIACSTPTSSIKRSLIQDAAPTLQPTTLPCQTATSFLTDISPLV